MNDENFNSIKVRLELAAFFFKSLTFPNFNSIKVRLELVLLFIVGMIFYFNSIKVRLELHFNTCTLTYINISIP